MAVSLAERRRALAERIAELGGDGLTPVEHFVNLVENAPRGTMWSIERATPQPTPGATRVVGGATITERPDLVYRDFSMGCTFQAPEPPHPAELAQVGPARR